MFNNDTKPVTLFTSEDDGAPKLTAAAGSFKTLLKACLITGYGAKQSLGWTMPFEDTNAAVFRSKAIDSNQFYLKINNEMPKMALIEPYRTMSGLQNGGGYFGRQGNYKRLGVIESGQNTAQHWWLCGHDQAFILIVSNQNRTHSAALFFGDVPTLAAADTGNTLCWHLHDYHYYDYFSGGNLDYSNSSNNDASPVFAKNYSGAETAASGYFGSFAQGQGLVYPDKITGGMIATEVYVYERSITGNSLRAEQPGLLKSLHNLSEFNEGADIGVLDGDDSRYLKFNLYSGRSAEHHYLLNVSHWRV